MWFRVEGRATSLSVGVRGLGFCLGRGEEEEKGPAALDDQAGKGSIENAMDGIWVPMAVYYVNFFFSSCLHWWGRAVLHPPARSLHSTWHDLGTGTYVWQGVVRAARLHRV